MITQQFSLSSGFATVFIIMLTFAGKVTSFLYCNLKSIDPPMSLYSNGATVKLTILTNMPQSLPMQVSFGTTSVPIPYFEEEVFPTFQYSAKLVVPSQSMPTELIVTSTSCNGSISFKYFDYNDFQIEFDQISKIKSSGGSRLSINFLNYTWLPVYNTMVLRLQSWDNRSMLIDHPLIEIANEENLKFSCTTYQSVESLGDSAEALISFDSSNFLSLQKNLTIISNEPLSVAMLYIDTIKDGGWSSAINHGELLVASYFGDSVRFTNFISMDLYGPVEIIEQTILSDSFDVVIFCTDMPISTMQAMSVRFPSIRFISTSMKGTFEPYLSDKIGYVWGTLYEARFLAGVAAGLVMSPGGYACYIKAWDNPEVNQGLNAFVLGIRKFNPTAIVLSMTIDTWGDVFLENQAVEHFLQDGRCELLAQHSDNSGPLEMFIESGKYVIGSCADMRIFLGENVITSAVFHWYPLLLAAISEAIGGQFNGTSYVQQLKDNAVALAPYSGLLSDVTRSKIDQEREHILQVGSQDYLFCGPLYDIDKNLRIPSGHCANNSDFYNMQWNVEGIAHFGKLEVKPPKHDDMQIETQLIVGSYVVLSLVLVFAILSFVWIFLFRDHPMIKQSQPYYAFLNIVGCAIGMCTIIPLTTSPVISDMEAFTLQKDIETMRFETSDRSCRAIPFILITGFCFTLPVLYSKILYRSQHAEDTTSSWKQFVVTWCKPWIVVPLFYVLCLTPVVVWQILDPLYWTQKISSEDDYGNPTESHGYCTSNHFSTFLSTLGGLIGFAIVYGSMLVYNARHDQDLSKESLWMTLIHANYLQTTIIVVILLVLTKKNPTARFAVCLLGLVCGFFGNLFLLVLPLFISVHKLFHSHNSSLRVEDILPKPRSQVQEFRYSNKVICNESVTTNNTNEQGSNNANALNIAARTYQVINAPLSKVTASRENSAKIAPSNLVEEENEQGSIYISNDE